MSFQKTKIGTPTKRWPENADQTQRTPTPKCDPNNSA